MLKMYINYFKTMARSKKGQGMVEYGLIIGLIAVVLIASLVALRTPIQNIFESISTKITAAQGTTTTP